MLDPLFLLVGRQNSMRRGFEIAIKGLTILTVLSVLAYALAITHDFFGYTETYPYVATDDVLGNLSYALAKEGRYGHLANPIQSGMGGWINTEVLTRHDGFLNYGPWYFYLGAGLIWLFGYSLALLRSIHLLIMAIAA